jgi:hypothetical protein
MSLRTFHEDKKQLSHLCNYSNSWLDIGICLYQTFFEILFSHVRRILRYFIASIILAAFLIIGKSDLRKKKISCGSLHQPPPVFPLYMIVFNIGMLQVTAATSSYRHCYRPNFYCVTCLDCTERKIEDLPVDCSISGVRRIVILTLIGDRFSSNTGVLLLLSCAIMLAIYNLLQKKLTKTYSALQITATAF